MTIAKDFAAKLAVAFVAVAMVFAAYAPAAQAQSSEDLQAMINDLLAQVAALQAQTGQGATQVASGVCPYTWTRDLSSGSTGADVMKLQQFLNADPDTRVAAAGAGSVGAETEYYGPATAAAVSKFQVKYRAEVLSPAGLVNPTGYFGPGSRAAANSKCTAAPVMDDEDMDDEDMDDGELQGEASLDNFELDDGESTLEEGDEDMSIGEITVEFTNGDAEISRIDITLVGDNSDQPWDAFDTISLWVDGDKIAEMDASDEDDYLDEDAGELRFTNLGLIAREDDSMEIIVAASVQNNLDAEELDGWTLEVSSFRFFDADGVAETESDPADGDESTFEIQEAGSDESLDISLASSNPDSTDIVVDTDSDTNGVTILVAELEAQDNDIELNTVVVLVTTTGATTTDVVDDIHLVIDGQEFDAEAIGTETDYSASANGAGTGLSSGKSEMASASTSVWYLFDIDGDVTIDEDDQVDMEVVVDFNDTDDGDRYANGATIKASVTSTETDEWDAEGADDLANGQYDGTAVGDIHTLVAEGILVPADGFDSETDLLGQDDTIGEFVLTFEVTAVEDDFYITSQTATSGEAGIDEGVVYSVTNATGGTVTAILDSTADEDTTDVFTVREGETETFTLTVTVDPAAAAAVRVTLESIFYSSATDGVVNGGVGDTEGEYNPVPASDFRTSSQSIND